MSRSVLLDTRTATLLELMGNGRLYAVPPFQRDYAWTEEEWEDLWLDIVALREDPDSRHYLGTLVVEGGDRPARIIDGQQRLATLTLLALAIIGRIRELADAGVESEANQDRAETLRGRFVGEKDPASLVVTPRLRLNQQDDPFFQDYLIAGRRPPNPRALPDSNRRLWRCAEWFSQALAAADTGLAEDGAALARFLNEVMGRQLLFILITVDDELNAYTVFETLNARGVELSATDLLKNYLFSRVRTPTDQEALHRRWTRLVDTVSHRRFPEFLRYHLQCSLPKVRSQRLFKIVRDQVRSGAEAFDLIDALSHRGELFNALSDEDHEFWIELPEARPHIRALALFRVKQMTPLLFAVWEALPRDVFVKVLRVVVVIAFRHTVVARRNTNELEGAYHRAAKAVLDGTARSAGEVFQRVRDVYVRDADFQADFERLQVPTHGQRKRLVRYILAELESDVGQRSCDFVTDPGTIEHILPENPAAEWDPVVAPARRREVIYRLGNLTWLEASLNRRVGSGLLASKREIYAESGYALTRELAEEAPEEWRIAAIDKRQRRLAKRAVHRWRVDY